MEERMHQTRQAVSQFKMLHERPVPKVVDQIEQAVANQKLIMTRSRIGDTCAYRNWFIPRMRLR